MDHLLPLPDDLVQRLQEHCIPFREEFYECRIDNGERQDPIHTPWSQLTPSATRMVYQSNPCRQWQLVETLLRDLNGRKIQQSNISGSFGVPVSDPMVLRPRAMGKSLSTEALLKTLASVAAKAAMPIVGHGGHFDLPDKGMRIHLRPPRPLFEEGHYFHRPYSYSPTKDYCDPPENLNTTDYPLPRGGKRIPKHGEKECKPSSVLLALIARSQ